MDAAASIAIREEEWGSASMKIVAEQLKVYQPPADDDDDEGEAGEIASSVGVPEANALPSALPSKRAAVLVCLFEGFDGELRVILTKRAGSLRTHSGEVALPGGKRDEADVDDAATAVREAYEEVGLEPRLVRVLACMEPFVSKHLFRVVPVLAVLPNKQEFKPQLNDAEVDSIFDAPLDMFLKDENHCSEQQEWLGSTYKLHYFEHDFQGRRYTIWGLTAAILIRTASIVYRKSPAFEEFSPDFRSIKKRYLLVNKTPVKVN